MSDLAEQIFGEAVSGTDSGLSLLSLLIVLEFAFAEEITFRLGIQNYLAKQLNWQGKEYWIAIVLTAALWTLGHTGIMEPGWVKLLQVFPIGLALGWLFRKVGTEGCILAHALFNVGMSVLTPLVFG
jgi:membrane protease YdiL (CAAX protease family)